MTDIFIYDAVRSPRGKGKPDGALHEVTALSLIAQMLGAVRDRNDLDTTLVDDVVLGCVSPVGEQGADIARSAVLAAGYDERAAGVQVNRFCGSGLEACNLAAAKVAFGEADLVIGGGIEAMSRVPMGSDGGALMSDPSLAFPIHFAPQGIGADLIATLDGYSRADVDGYAVESHRRAAQAWEEGRFARSIVPVVDSLGAALLDHDEMIRPQTTIETLAALKPSFEQLGLLGFDDVVAQKYPQVDRVTHVHHAGNSSGIVDGAAAILIGNSRAGQAIGLAPRARFVASASIGSEPSIMLTGPEFAARKALNRAGMTAADIDLWEINEAFASVAMRFRRALELDPDQVNVNGGAIAMGHPLGATGAMILGSVLDELERTGKRTALVTLCIGGGMANATIIERV